MKKILSTVLFILCTILIGVQTQSVEAADQYLGVYEDGREAYLDWDTVKYYRDYKGEYIVGEGYTCTVKAVYPGSDRVNEYINYKYKYGPQTEGLSKNGVMYYMRQMSELYKKTNHPENQLVITLRNYFKKNFGNI